MDRASRHHRIPPFKSGNSFLYEIGMTIVRSPLLLTTTVRSIRCQSHLLFFLPSFFLPLRSSSFENWMDAQIRWYAGPQPRRTGTESGDTVAARGPGCARGVCGAYVICVIWRVVASAGAETTLITSSASARPAEAFSLFSVAAGVAVLAAVARRPRETRGTGTVSCPRPMRAARAAPRP